MFSSDLKRGSMELFILSALEGRTRHGYDIGNVLELRSVGHIQVPISTLYSTLHRMEDRGWIKGRWVEKSGERRRCCYTLTPKGQATLAAQREEWAAFSMMVSLVIGANHAELGNMGS
jgi:PadR family transcriptional regulator PadR